MSASRQAGAFVAFLAFAAILAFVALTAGRTRETRLRAAVNAPSSAAPALKDDAAVEDEKARLREVAGREGAVAAYDLLKKDWSDRPVRAHILAHLAGELLYREKGADGIATCDMAFAGGCYHGLLAALLKEKGGQGLTLALAACDKLPDATAVGACEHGIGHGVNEWQGDIASAVKTCGGLPKESQRYHCDDGAYMDFYMGVMTDAGRPTVTAGDPWRFCATARNEAEQACVRNHMIYILASHQLTVAQAAAACGALDASLKLFCVSSAGHFAADRKGRSADTIRAFCGNFTSEEDRAACVDAAGAELEFQGGDPAIARILRESVKEAVPKE